MCGINGILRISPEAPPLAREEALLTRDAMTVRGPDDAGLWTSDSGLIALASRRLAILDTSPAGHQPMSSSDGRFHLVFNGEIYNFRELRSAHESAWPEPRSGSDTEVVLQLLSRGGPKALRELRGMYALALWDDQEERLLLARDPYGIKPLYYSTHGGCLRFASQLKALEHGGRIPDAIDPAGLCGFLLWGSVPEPWTLRTSVKALEAGHYLEVTRGHLGTPASHHEIDLGADPQALPPSEALRDSIRSHLVSDVPVAIFLSGGLDSALIAECACAELLEPPTTLTLRFAEFKGSKYDEGPGARRTAEALGTRHHERTMTREEFGEIWEPALEAMDQPSIDGFNIFCVSRFAREAGFKVVLSGLGGDELMGGYPSFAQVQSWAAAARLFGILPGLTAVWPWAVPFVARAKPKLAGFLEHGQSVAGAYFLRRGLFLPREVRRLVGNAMADEGFSEYDAVRDAESRLRPLAEGRAPSARERSWLAVHLLESGMYLRNQLLRDADWASMASSVELRTPLVDACLRRALAASRFEPAQSQGRAELIRTVTRRLPASVFATPKTGFHIPLGEWLGRSGNSVPRPGWGLDSRHLAFQVLRHRGIDLRP